eukprot:3237436-Pleurochrysis_carterae.AAC.1
MMIGKVGISPSGGSLSRECGMSSPFVDLNALHGQWAARSVVMIGKVGISPNCGVHPTAAENARLF